MGPVVFQKGGVSLLHTVPLWKVLWDLVPHLQSQSTRASPGMLTAGGRALNPEGGECVSKNILTPALGKEL